MSTILVQPMDEIVKERQKMEKKGEDEPVLH